MSLFNKTPTKDQTTPRGIHGRRSASIHGWIFEVSHAIQDRPLSPSDTSDEPKSPSSLTVEIQFEDLMAEYAEVLERKEKLEDKIADLDYAQQKSGDITFPASWSSSAFTSMTERQEAFNHKGKSTAAKKQDLPSTSSDYKEYSPPDQVQEKVKDRKPRKPKTEEEKNRHINKVFIRNCL
ncbi:hypothetical protein HYE67_002058 [Fusarium culmorum]|uniref:Uncharacterized protein n=1 Tax=Fusarium culmorum TaxID=5516 RepID=A0A7S8D0R0_FUSCU|nr:hypothetical protein HYE67_002058 [Fusarium culmorum]